VAGPNNQASWASTTPHSRHKRGIFFGRYKSERKRQWGDFIFSRRSLLKGILGAAALAALAATEPPTQPRKPGRPLLVVLNGGRPHVAATFGFPAIGAGTPGDAPVYGCPADGFAAGLVFATDSPGGSFDTVVGR
jgi:hypothetical protein